MLRSPASTLCWVFNEVLTLKVLTGSWLILIVVLAQNTESHNITDQNSTKGIARLFLIASKNFENCGNFLKKKQKNAFSKTVSKVMYSYINNFDILTFIFLLMTVKNFQLFYSEKFFRTFFGNKKKPKKSALKKNINPVWSKLSFDSLNHNHLPLSPNEKMLQNFFATHFSAGFFVLRKVRFQYSVLAN